jgi:hypothetical protein
MAAVVGKATQSWEKPQFSHPGTSLPFPNATEIFLIFSVCNSRGKSHSEKI